MADGVRPALGLSIGATNFAAVTPDHSITRKPVLTLFRQRAPEVGVPSENPRLDQPGLVITDFVDRVGDRVGIVAADGSIHRSEALVADGLRALAYSVTGGRALPDHVAVTYPAHWGAPAVDALGAALSRVSEWSHSGKPLTLIPDAAAALFAVRANPGIPARGIVVICDLGGSGTSITLVDAGGDYHPVAPTLRHDDFSGDLIDQSLLTYVMSELPATGSFDPTATAAIGSLSRLRSECRNAKERLSATTVTTLAQDVPGMRGEVRLTRNELEETVRGALDGFVRAVEQTLSRSGIHESSVVAIATVGGGANIPAVTTSLSGRFGVPVVTTPRPQLTAAIGGALRAARGPAETSATVLTPAAAIAAAPAAAPVARPLTQEEPADGGAGLNSDAPVSLMQPALAWSEAADDASGLMPAASGSRGGSGLTSARPQLAFEESSPAPERKKPPLPWYRLPAVMIISTTVTVLLVGTAVAIGLTSHDKGGSKSPPVSTAPVTSAPSSAPPPTSTAGPPSESTPPPSPASESPPPPTRETPPPQSSQAPVPTTEAPQPPPTTQPPAPTQAPPTQAPPPTTQAPVPQQPTVAPPSSPPAPQGPQLPQIPGLPRIPGIPGALPAPGIRVG